LHYTGIEPKKITLGPDSFVLGDITPEDSFVAGAYTGYISPKEIELAHGPRAAFLLAETQSTASRIREHGSVAKDAHSHPTWKKYLPMGRDFEFGVTIRARDTEKKRWVHIYRHYVVRLPSWDHPIVGWEWKHSWYRISTDYPEAPPRSPWYLWFVPRVMEGVTGSYPGE
jgi:hypothetical protein